MQVYHEKKDSPDKLIFVALNIKDSEEYGDNKDTEKIVGEIPYESS